ncbi:MAG TPA: L,D-transpeptidase [Candidatus Hydrogenedentes bacterium]|nr:L,D-transpeptidase [Candidatus Hydrogenedentota bacterium]
MTPWHLRLLGTTLLVCAIATGAIFAGAQRARDAGIEVAETSRLVRESETVVQGEPTEVEMPEDAVVESEGSVIAMTTSEFRHQPRLEKDDRTRLEQFGWSDRVAEGCAVWVSVARQMLYLIEDNLIIWQAACSTAANGVGSEFESFKTPLGWHRVMQKVGDGAPWGQEFKSRRPTRTIWKPGDESPEDMVLTRILVLEGLEPGQNRGHNAAGVCVDSTTRGIYIHGTNGEALIGTPASHGCVRLTNDDMITAFDLIAKGTLVLITE